MAHARTTNAATPAIRRGSIDDPAIARWLGQRNGDVVRDGLARGGVELQGPQSGTFKTRQFTASATLEADDVVQLRAPADSFEHPIEALRRGAGLPGNARLAMSGVQWRLAAETRVNGAAHLPESLAEIKRGFLSLIGKPAKRDADQTPDDTPPDAAMKSAIHEAGWTNEQAVETDDGWELHPRVAGAPVPVRAVLTADAVMLRRTIISDINRDGSAAALHQALSLNERLRFCRLAVVDERLVVETVLRAALICSDWLIYAAQAVASAARAVEPELKLLMEETAVAKAYAEMFLR